MIFKDLLNHYKVGNSITIHYYSDKEEGFEGFESLNKKTIHNVSIQDKIIFVGVCINHSCYIIDGELPDFKHNELIKKIILAGEPLIMLVTEKGFVLTDSFYTKVEHLTFDFLNKKFGAKISF